MFRLEKTFRFEAAHRLPHHDGKCARLHGHSWVGCIVCEGTILCPLGSSKEGMLIDYGDMKRAIEPVVETYLDHYDLNETLAQFGIVSPTSEEIARWLFQILFPVLGTVLVETRVEETCTSRCVYRPSWEEQTRPLRSRGSVPTQIPSSSPLSEPPKDSLTG